MSVPGIRMLESVDDAFTASDVLSQVWDGDRSGMPPNLLRALSSAGEYTAGLFVGERMVGASVAFFAEPAARSMHSHITGVLGEFRGHGLGTLLKRHQQEWALARGVGRITWTFDPLVARNAHVNLTVLGTRAVEYLVNQYGPMDDGVNRGDETDRILVSWELASASAAPPRPDQVVAVVAVPADIEAVRREAPVEAATWRHTVREQLQGHLAAGLVIGGFDPVRGYLLVNRR
ncbi:GNAT family N-acetyltransferase [Microbacterium sp. 18062]|uniref:GNAT family N-acetyltransferase n=1 Tax=Microbacterium sp. 18062 TaxID=2681410 RepID=UPI00135BBF54|nr:GNAT family N-acetyltransferase [Microbacterium sp. 18062]